MNELIVDGSRGLSGNTMVGSLINLGMKKRYLQENLEKVLPVESFRLIVKDSNAGELTCTYFNTEPGPDCKQYDSMLAMEALGIISESDLEEEVKGNALKCLTLLFESKAKAHAIPFHEVRFSYEGMVDTIIDIIGTCLGLYHFGIKKVLVTPVNTGHGQIVLPQKTLMIPAPMTRFLIGDFPHYQDRSEREGEKVTPTGAAILKCFAEKTDISYEGVKGRAAFSSPFPESGFSEFLRVTLL